LTTSELELFVSNPSAYVNVFSTTELELFVSNPSAYVNVF